MSWQKSKEMDKKTITIKLKPKKEESLRRFHPWVFSGAIQSMDRQPAEGEIVRVVDSENIFLAIGHYEVGSIAVRVLSFENVDIDSNFISDKIQKAYQLRQMLGLSNREAHNIYRLVHGEGDNLSGLIVDIYGDTAVMQAHSVGMHHMREALAEAIVKLVDGVDHVFYKSETTLPFRAPIDKKNHYLIGGEKANPVAYENGLKFNINWLEGQKTGFFVDQRDNRAMVEHFAKDKKVLNLFCYTGGFSVYALRGGASLVHSVDSSEKAVELTRKNVELNFPENNNHTAYTEDVFKFFQLNNEKYDLIILDPPAFAKHRSAIRNALKGYQRINQKAIEQLNPGGVLFTFSCSQAISKEQFRLSVFSAAAQTKKSVQILQQLEHPADHPINIYHPEGEYLKGLVLKVETD